MKLNDLVEKVKEVNVKNWKTSAGAVIAALGPVLLALGLPENVAAAITTLGVFIIGIFAKDSNVTNGTVDQGGIR